MRLRRWFYAIASVFAVALVMFPLNFLWVGQSPLHAAVSSLLFGLPALLSAWTPKERRTGRRNESRGTAVCAQSRRCAGAGIHAAPAGALYDDLMRNHFLAAINQAVFPLFRYG